MAQETLGPLEIARLTIPDAIVVEQSDQGSEVVEPESLNPHWVGLSTVKVNGISYAAIRVPPLVIRFTILHRQRRAGLALQQSAAGPSALP